MRVLRTVSISDAVLDALDSSPMLTIAGVYERSVALLCGDEVFSLVGSDTGNLPRGLLVDSASGFDWKKAALHPGAPARREGRYLSLSPELALDLVAAGTWQARRYLPGVAAAPHSVRSAVGRVAQYPPSSQGGLGDASKYLNDILLGILPAFPADASFAAHSAGLLCRLSRAIQDQNGVAFVEAALGLVGLGIGLTPSGDDVLTGAVGALVLMADWSSGLGWVRPAADTLVMKADGRTTPLSMTLLRCAARGEIIEGHENLLKTVLAGDAEGSWAARASLAAFGHSSGSEIALGTLLAVRSAGY